MNTEFNFLIDKYWEEALGVISNIPKVSPSIFCQNLSDGMFVLSSSSKENSRTVYGSAGLYHSDVIYEYDFEEDCVCKTPIKTWASKQKRAIAIIPENFSDTHINRCVRMMRSLVGVSYKKIGIIQDISEFYLERYDSKEKAIEEVAPFISTSIVSYSMCYAESHSVHKIENWPYDLLISKKINKLFRF